MTEEKGVAALETPSGKNETTENFPVGSWLIPKRLRPHVAVFYQFARAIDDIADNPALSPEEKISRLHAFEEALIGREATPGTEKAVALRQSNMATDVPYQHGVDLISAFKQDAVKSRYSSWDELIDYCLRSASPVGRFLLDLHGEDPVHYEASDALCNALQVINHLQDCKDDFEEMDRVYIPQDWMSAEGTTVSALSDTKASPEMRRVLDRAVAGTETLLETAKSLPGRMKNRGLRMESAVIVVIAEKLTARLRAQDPIATRVKLSKPALIGAALTGVARGI
ncbi:MAG: squalene synthase HpnC [Pseudomonadota bacterium]